MEPAADGLLPSGAAQRRMVKMATGPPQANGNSQPSQGSEQASQASGHLKRGWWQTGLLEIPKWKHNG